MKFSRIDKRTWRETPKHLVCSLLKTSSIMIEVVVVEGEETEEEEGEKEAVLA